jgi:hypothetical protein
MAIKSDRLKKLEVELEDLEQWLKLGLVPKNEIKRHEDEIYTLKERIIEEKERLQFLKESGDLEEYSTPRRSPHKTVYPDTPTMSDIDNESVEENHTNHDMATETMEVDASEEEDSDKFEAEEADETIIDDEDEVDPFSDSNRWRRGGIIDPDATEW